MNWVHLGRIQQKLEREIPNQILQLFPSSADSYGVIRPDTISSGELLKQANVQGIKKTTLYANLQRFQGAGIISSPRKGFYRLNPVPFSWEWIRRTQPHNPSLKNMLTEEGLRRGFQLAFEFLLRDYMEMLHKLVAIDDRDAARDFLASFFEKRETVQGPLGFLAQSIYAKRKKAPLDSLDIIKLSLKSGQMGIS